VSTAARKRFSLGCLLTSNRCCACRKEGFFKLLETEREKLGAARREEVAALEAKHTELRTDHEALTATNEELRAQQAKDKARRIAILAEQAVSLYCHLCCQVLPRVRECRRCGQEERKQLKEQLEETLADHHAGELAALRTEAAARHAELEGKVAAVEDQCLQAQTASDCEQRLVSSERVYICPPLQLVS